MLDEGKDPNEANIYIDSAKMISSFYSSLPAGSGAERLTDKEVRILKRFKEHSEKNSVPPPKKDKERIYDDLPKIVSLNKSDSVSKLSIDESK